MEILAGIVTYNPEIDKLKANLQGVVPQVNQVLIVDNGSENISEILSVLTEFPTVEIEQFSENKGIAAALNKIGQAAVNASTEYFLTLDQDSVLLEGTINEMKKYLDLPQLGLLNCYHTDRNVDGDPENLKLLTLKKPIMYTSGSLMPTALFADGIQYDERLFIDMVDNDLDMQLMRAGYKLYQIPYLGLLHELGNTETHKFLNKTILTHNHSPFRRYYIYRNAIVFIKKYGLSWITFSFLLFDIKVLMNTIIFEKERAPKIKETFRGLIAGLRYKV